MVKREEILHSEENDPETVDSKFASLLNKIIKSSEEGNTSSLEFEEEELKKLLIGGVSDSSLYRLFQACLHNKHKHNVYLALFHW